MSANPTILVAEDDSNDVILLALAFKKALSPATVHFVEGGREAIYYLRGNEPYGNRAQFPLPNLFVVNLRLSGMSGFELLDWVRGQPFLQRMVIGVLSEVDHQPDTQKALALGAKFWMIKPNAFDDLVEIARRLTAECAVGLSDTEISAHPPDASRRVPTCRGDGERQEGRSFRTSQPIGGGFRQARSGCIRTTSPSGVARAPESAEGRAAW